MHYEGNIIRPPSEAHSILLQVTVGCSHNKCTFCGAYKGERFKIKPDDVIMADIDFAARYARHQRRVFICDGDALIVPQARLTAILAEETSPPPNATAVRWLLLTDLPVTCFDDARECGRGICSLNSIMMVMALAVDEDRAVALREAHPPCRIAEAVGWAEGIGFISSPSRSFQLSRSNS